MDGDVVVGIPVSADVAEALQDASRAKAIGKLVEALVKQQNTAVDPLVAMIAEIKADARAAGLTDADIDAELDAYNSERRL